MPVNSETALQTRREQRVTEVASAVSGKLPVSPDATPSVRDPGKRLQKATGWCLRQFRVHDLARALSDEGVTVEWLVKLLVEMAKDKDCPPTAKLLAWKELRRLQLVVAEVDPRVQAPVKRRASRRGTSVEVTPDVDPVVQMVEFPKIAGAAG